MSRLLAIDTETTGIDAYHGARPFLVTTCTLSPNTDPSIIYWGDDWEIDPILRQVTPLLEDLDAIQEAITSADVIVGQNIKFDVTQLSLLFQDNNKPFEWPWHKTYCTLTAGHLLASNQKHDLTSMCIQYLGEDISKYEVAVKKAIIKARFLAKHDYPEWQLAKKGNPLTPSAKTSTWGYDMWLPRVLAKKYNYSDNHPWWTVVSEYANTDSMTTAFLWKEMEKKLKSRQLWKIFLERMKLVPIAFDLERRGITLNRTSLINLIKQYREEAEEFSNVCVNIAESLGFYLKMPRSGNNQSLREFCFGAYHLVCRKCGYKSSGTVPYSKTPTNTKPQLCPECSIRDTDNEVRFNSEGCIISGLPSELTIEKVDYLNLPPIRRSARTGEPSLDKETLATYEDILPPRSKALTFSRNLRSKRKRNTAIQYLTGYMERWLPVEDDYFRLHGGANHVGTDTLRWSFSNPNVANISKQEDEETGESYNLRIAFGPDPSREWYKMDGQNLELRIPSYEADEKDAIYVFEHPKDPPYFGSYHLLVFDLLHPELFKRHGKECKTLYESTWYQWIKNGNFCIIYGGQEKKADITYHVEGAYKKVRYRFPKIAKLADRQIALANHLGYVETIPDRLIDPSRGYPIMCARTDYGGILPTVPLNYHIQSTAMQWTNTGMIKTTEKLKEWQKQGFDGYITLQVHDELVFSFPRSRVHPRVDYEKERAGKTYFRTSNLWRARVLQRLMESSGDRIGVPTPVSVSYHDDNWSKGFGL